MSDTPIGFEQAALDALADPVAYHNNIAFPRDVAYWNQRRYTNYARECANKSLSIDAGRAPASDWPTIPFEVGVGVSTDGYKNAEPGMDGPNTLDQVDPVKFPVLTAPADNTMSRSTTGPQSGLGNPAGTMVLGILIPGRLASTRRCRATRALKARPR